MEKNKNMEFLKIILDSEEILNYNVYIQQMECII